MVILSVFRELTTAVPSCRAGKRILENGTVISGEPFEWCYELFVLDILSELTTIFFLFDLLLRFVVSPNKLRYVTRVTNILDVIAILSAGLSFVVDADLTILRLAKYVRFVRVLRCNSGMALLLLALCRSKWAFLLFTILIGINSLFFGTMFYVCEQEQYEHYYGHSVSFGLYWALITMTTVGYGDIYPLTVAGKVVACFCAISGLCLVALPISAIVQNFSVLRLQYSDQTRHAKEENVTSGKVNVTVYGQKT